MIWLTSDLHFGHSRNFLYEPRGFETIEEHDEAIIKNWNAAVGEEDTVYILGDLMLNDDAHGINCLRRLNGKKLIICGNHDSANRIELYKQLYNVEVLGYSHPLKYCKYNFLLSHYPTLTDNKDGDKPLKRRVINLCGHRHSTDRWIDWDKGLIYHIELDCHDITPVCIDDIIEEIKERMNEDN